MSQVEGGHPGGQAGEALRAPKRGALSPRALRAAKLGVPPGLFLASIPAAYFAFPFDRFVAWVGFLYAYMFVPLGREIAIPLMLLADFSAAQAVLLIVLVDFVAASFLAWNLDLLRGAPYIGGFIARVERAGTSLRARRPSLNALGIAGLFLWTVKPGRGSGGATSAVLGKLVFVESRWLLPTIVAGSLIGCAAVALAAQGLFAAGGGALVWAAVPLLAAAALLYLWNIRGALSARLSAGKAP